MTSFPEHPEVDYSVCGSADVDELARLLGEVFSKRDPPAYAVSLSAKEFEDFVRLFSTTTAACGLTVIARYRKSGDMVGAMLTEDCAGAMPGGLDKLSPKFDPVFDILGQLDTEYWQQRERRPGEAIHLFLLGVAESAGGKGIGKQLVQTSLDLGASKGYRRAVTEATNPTSQHIFKTLGFTERVRRSYADHTFEGRRYFESIADKGGPILMDRSIAPV